MKRESPYTLANRITLARILGVPVFALMLIYYTMSLERGTPQSAYRWLALALFCAVAATDALDGYFARSRNEITDLGRMLDPLADKLLLLTALIVLTRPSLPALNPQIPVWLTLLVISRDILLVAGLAVIHHFAGVVHVRPRIPGKLATAFLMLAVVWILAAGPSGFLPWLTIPAGLFTLISGTAYFLDGVRQLETHGRAPPP